MSTYIVTRRMGQYRYTLHRCEHDDTNALRWIPDGQRTTLQPVQVGTVTAAVAIAVQVGGQADKIQT